MINLEKNIKLVEIRFITQMKPKLGFCKLRQLPMQSKKKNVIITNSSNEPKNTNQPLMHMTQFSGEALKH